MKNLLVMKYFRLLQLNLMRRKYIRRTITQNATRHMENLLTMKYFRLPKHILPRQKYICRLINRKIKWAWRVYWWRNIFVSHNLSFPAKKYICHQINKKMKRHRLISFEFIGDEFLLSQKTLKFVTKMLVSNELK